MTLDEIADALDKASRMGSELDSPEGTRFIQISDTLAQQFSQALRGHHSHVAEYASHTTSHTRDSNNTRKTRVGKALETKRRCIAVKRLIARPQAARSGVNPVLNATSGP